MSFCHSDHEMVELKIFSVMRKKFIKVAALYFKRANFKLRRELHRSVLWESAFEGLGFYECWSVLKNHHLKAQEQVIPLCYKLRKEGRTPASVNRKFFLELRRKKRLDYV